MTPLRILLVLDNPPLAWGATHAKWGRILVRELVARGHQLTTFAVYDQPASAEQARQEFPADQYDLRLFPAEFQRTLQSRWQALTCPNSLRFTPALRSAFAAEVAKQPYDILHLESTWTGWVGWNCDAARALLTIPCSYNFDEAHQPGGTLRERVVSGLRRWAERRLIRRYENLLTLTPTLQTELQTVAPRSQVDVVPFGLDAQDYRWFDAPQEAPVVGVVGSMHWYPSYAAAVRLLTRLAPVLRQRVPGVRFLIGGWGARERLQPFLTEPDVEILENVPDPVVYFAGLRVLLYAPSPASGMKIKVLEAALHGVPAVTTPDGVDGLPLQDGVDVGVALDDAGLIERTVALLADRQQYERQRQAARHVIAEFCSPGRTVSAVESIYARMLAGRTSSPQLQTRS